MVVRHLKTPADFVRIRKIIQEQFVVGNAGDEGAVFGINIVRVCIRKNADGGRVAEGGEEEGLFGPQFQLLTPLLPFLVVQEGGTLGHHHDIGLSEAGREVPQVAPGIEPVLENGVVVIYQHDAQRGPEAAVLEGIVQHDDPGALELLASVDAVFIHGDGDVGEFPGNLDGLVTKLKGRSVVGNNLEAFGLSFIPPGKDGRLFPLCNEHTQNHFHMGRLPCSAGSYIADANSRNYRGETFFPALIVKEMPYSKRESVNHNLQR